MTDLAHVALGEPEPTPWLLLAARAAGYGAAIGAAGALAGGWAAFAVGLVAPLLADWRTP